MRSRYLLLTILLIVGSLMCTLSSAKSTPPEGQSMVVEETFQNENTSPTANAAIAEDESSPPEISSTTRDPELPRDFSFSLPLFAPNSAWNQSAAGAAVLLESDQQILVTYRVLLGDTTSLHPTDDPPGTTWPFIDVTYDEWTIPVFRAGAGQQSVLICEYEGAMSWPSPNFPDDQQKEGGPVTIPSPAVTVRPSDPQGTFSDGHLVLYDPVTFMEYDFWQATTQREGECESLGGGLIGTNILETGAIEFFDVRGSGSNLDTYASARAHGTPLLAGMLLPEDVDSGAIAHALAFALPGPRNLSKDHYEPLSSDYFYPTSTTETDYYSTNPHALAAGQRIRLKDTIYDDEGDIINENQLAPITRLFLTALRKYGAYLVDSADGFTFYAEDIHTAVLHLSDDEVKALIGASPGTALPPGKTKWQIVLEKLNDDLELVPFAYGPWQNYQNPETATIIEANYKVVDYATQPGTSLFIYLPLTMNFPLSQPNP